MRYGDNNTIHRTGHVDVEVAPDGHVVSVWFRCLALPFEEHQVEINRAADMKSMYQGDHILPIEAIVTADEPPKPTFEDLLDAASDWLERNHDQLTEVIAKVFDANNIVVTDDLSPEDMASVIEQYTPQAEEQPTTFTCDKLDCFEDHCAYCRQPLSYCECEDPNLPDEDPCAGCPEQQQCQTEEIEEPEPECEECFDEEGSYACIRPAHQQHICNDCPGVKEECDPVDAQTCHIKPGYLMRRLEILFTEPASEANMKEIQTLTLQVLGHFHR